MILHSISEKCSIPLQTIASLTFSKQNRYRQFVIPKRTGGIRTIKTPVPSLLKVQRYIANSILNEIAIHESATGFRVGLSIIDHVNKHVGKTKFIKIDIADCFNSISSGRIFSTLMRNGVSRLDSHILTLLCTDENCLPQGAATSPVLCNGFFYNADQRIFSLCNQLGLDYTRYADDILISGEGCDPSIFKTVCDVVNSVGLAVNKKSCLVDNPSKLIICGLSIASGRIRVARSFKRKVRMDAHFLHENGIIHESAFEKNLDPLYYDRIMGKLAFWTRIEPDAHFPKLYMKLIRDRYALDIGAGTEDDQVS